MIWLIHLILFCFSEYWIYPIFYTRNVHHKSMKWTWTDFGRQNFFIEYMLIVFFKDPLSWWLSTKDTDCRRLGSPEAVPPYPYTRCFGMHTTDALPPALQGHACCSTVSGISREHTTQCNFTLLSITGVIHTFLGDRKGHGYYYAQLTEETGKHIAIQKVVNQYVFEKVLLPMKLNL